MSSTLQCILLVQLILSTSVQCLELSKLSELDRQTVEIEFGPNRIKVNAILNFDTAVTTIYDSETFASNQPEESDGNKLNAIKSENKPISVCDTLKIGDTKLGNQLIQLLPKLPKDLQSSTLINGTLGLARMRQQSEPENTRSVFERDPRDPSSGPSLWKLSLALFNPNKMRRRYGGDLQLNEDVSQFCESEGYIEVEAKSDFRWLFQIKTIQSIDQSKSLQFFRGPWNAVINPAEDYIYLPNEIYETLTSKIEMQREFTWMKTPRIPYVQFVSAEHTFTVDKDDFFRKIDIRAVDRVFRSSAGTIYGTSNEIVFGMPFFTNFCVHLDNAKSTIGFSKISIPK